MERLCADGCQAVRAYIKQLEEDESVPHTENLSAKEKQLVLAELKAIMAVYDQ